MSSSLCTDLNDYVCESLFCLVSLKNCDVYVGVCYNSPNSSDEEVAELLRLINNIGNKNVLLMGDFNYPNIDWNTLNTDSRGSLFLEATLDSFLTQHVHFPTRGDNTLDLVFTCEESNVEDMSSLCFSNSDHCGLLWKFLCNVNCSFPDKVLLDYNNADYAKVNSELSVINWISELNDLSVNDMWLKFCTILDDVCKKCIPTKVSSTSNVKPKWMNKEAFTCFINKQRAWKRYCKNKNPDNLSLYKTALNRASTVYKKAKKDYEEKLAKDIKSNHKHFFSYVRSKSVVKDVVGPLKDSTGNLLVNNVDVCNTLNDYFVSVFTDESVLPTAPNIRDLTNDELNDVEITQDVVCRKMKQLRSNKSPGVDGIPSKLLIETAQVTSLPLSIIYQSSILSGDLPDDWKMSNISPVFKSGSKLEPNNYRPISLTSHCCKMLESIIKDSIMEHIYKLKLLNKSQHGFLPKRSCLTNLLTFFEKVHDWIDNGDPVDVLYLDFKKAFDKVPHQRLLLKISSFGIKGYLYSWIRNWLLGRKQRVVLNNNVSSWKPVSSGVPQGSVLGPILFLLFINDLDSDIVNVLLKFADDAKLFGRVNDDTKIGTLKDDILKLSTWAKEWGMQFNIDKCKVMHIGKNNSNCVYDIDNTPISTTVKEKDLGVVVSNDLKVSSHCVASVKTANRMLGLIKRTFTSRSESVVLKLYKSLVRPHLDYCNSVCNPHLKKDINLMEGVQRRATKLIYKFQNLDYGERLSRLKLTTLETRRTRGDLIETFKLMNGYTDLNHELFFTLSDSNLRGHTKKLFKQRVNTNVGKFSFSNRVVNLWNRLPDNVISSNSINMFKNNLDQLLVHGWGLT